MPVDLEAVQAAPVTPTLRLP